ncbi:MAG: M4 family metallopeptidase [Chitinophagaceae bacterium]|nr:M4 family metallopeptidase [Chitinophagaceae bacterium]
MNKHLRLLPIILFLLSFFNVKSQVLVDTLMSNDGRLRFAKFNTEIGAVKTVNAHHMLRTVLGLNSNDELRLVKSVIDELGFQHDLYQQFYANVKVDKHTFAVHSRNGIIETINGDFGIIQASVDKGIGEISALQSAIRYCKANKYRWEIKEAELFLKTVTKNQDTSFYPKAEMVFFYDKLNSGYRFSYKFTIAAADPFFVKEIYVDAFTGEIINENLLTHLSNSPGTAQTRYSGSQNLITDSYAGGYRLIENRNGVSIETKNARNVTFVLDAVDFTDNDNNWTAAEHDNANFDNAALDVHWAAEKIYDYFLNVHSRNSIDRFGMPIKSFVHYDFGGCSQNNNDNAQWDPGFKIMLFADGCANFKPIAALDVVGHEISHGINDYPIMSQPLLGNGEAGAIGEGLADIYGATIEQYSVTGKQTWLMGEDIIKAPNKVAARNMQNPNDPNVVQPGADTYGGNLWINPASSFDYGGVHYNCGVLNFWYYLLVQGGSGVNDIANSYHVNGIGIDKAIRIVYRMEQYYLLYNSTFADARAASLTASTELFGQYSCETQSVTNAWYAVGVGAAYSASNPPQINGDFTNWCTGINRVYSTCVVPGATYNWGVTSNMSIVSGQGTSQVTIAPQSLGYATVSLTVTNSGVSASNSATLEIFPSTISGTIQQPGQPDKPMYSANGIKTGPATVVLSYPGNVTFTCTRTSGSGTWSFSGNVLSLNLSSNQSATFSMGTTSTCIVSQSVTFYVSMYGFRASPNPAKTVLDIEALKNQNYAGNDVIGESDLEYTARLFNFNTGALVRQVKNIKGNRKVQMNVVGLNPGQYVLRISYGNNNTDVRQILIE